MLREYQSNIPQSELGNILNQSSMSKDIKYLVNNIIILTTMMKIMLTTNCVVAENTQNLAC